MLFQHFLADVSCNRHQRLFRYASLGQPRNTMVPQIVKSQIAQARTLSEPLTVAQLLERLGYDRRRVAVEVNFDVVPAVEHAGRVLGAVPSCCASHICQRLSAVLTTMIAPIRMCWISTGT